MTPLAREIYKSLLRHLRASQCSITYGELAAKVKVHPRSPTFHAALTEVTEACRAHALPCLPAIVWRRGAHQPSTGYFAAAHPRARTEKAQRAAWEREHAQVVAGAARFPQTLP